MSVIVKIEANDKEVQDIIGAGYFKIPRFQRPYSWELDEVANFWNDIIKDNSLNYFIGSMVVYQDKKPYFGIVDGQQRLTTITLILASIRNAFKELQEDALAKGLHKYIERANIDNEDEFILFTESSFPYLQKQIQSYESIKSQTKVGIEENNLKQAFDYINKSLVSYIPEIAQDRDVVSKQETFESLAIPKLKLLRNKILSLKLVFIQLDNEEDAYLIFETLNARGRDLTSADLIKNLLLKKIKTKHAYYDDAKESWNNLVKKIDNINEPNVLDSFLLHYWLSEHDYTTDKNLFSEVKKYVEDKDSNAHELLESLNRDIDFYYKMLKPLECDWTKEEVDIKNSLHSLNIFRVRQQSSMVLSLLRAYYGKRISLRVIKITLKKIENFHYVFNAITSQRSSGSIVTNYSKLAIQLHKAQSEAEIQSTLNQLSVSLKNKLPEENEFLVNFSALSYLSNKTRDKAFIRYSLEKLLNDTPSALTIDKDNLTLEHIIPEKEIKLGGNEKIIGSIGNLILVDQKTNAEDLAAKQPDQKLKILSAKNFPFAKFLIDPSLRFLESSVILRTQELGKKIYSIVRI